MRDRLSGFSGLARSGMRNTASCPPGSVGMLTGPKRELRMFVIRFSILPIVRFFCLDDESLQ